MPSVPFSAPVSQAQAKACAKRGDRGYARWRADRSVVAAGVDGAGEFLTDADEDAPRGGYLTHATDH
ncbi:hypothetical protein CHELA40_30157 [Chelatococcus asaccharovorans]|nr:hypothetical protein CHELA17_40257 [Chelatococcus asaccharovorans]CAH1688140.1 hypothetical protein CHELA40_30157 [Chelatococcus asaccharovorans]